MTVPYLVAANPVNYGKRNSPLPPSSLSLTPRPTAYKLTCLEAIAAALYMTGYDKHAAALLDKFSWGHSFWEINGPILNRYKTCTDAESVLAMQEVMLLEMEREDDDRR